MTVNGWGVYLDFATLTDEQLRTAKEILKEIIINECTDDYDENFSFYEDSVIKAMESYAEQNLNKHLVMQVPQFEELLQVRLEELPYTKHLDDGQYNDGQAYGFECGARWAYEKLSSGTTVGKAGEDASVSAGM